MGDEGVDSPTNQQSTPTPPSMKNPVPKPPRPHQHEAPKNSPEAAQPLPQQQQYQGQHLKPIMICIIKQCDWMDKKFNWMENEYMHFYSSDINNVALDFSNDQNGSEQDDQVRDLGSFSFCTDAKRFNLPTSYKTEQVATVVSGAEDKGEPSARIVNCIEVGSCGRRIHQVYSSKFNSKVANLNKFLKTKTLGFLKMLEDGKLLTIEESSALQAYQRDSCSQASNERLFSLDSVRDKCSNFYTSSQLARNVLESETNFNRKIQLLKSLGKVAKGEKKKKGKGPIQEKNSN